MEKSIAPSLALLGTLGMIAAILFVGGELSVLEGEAFEWRLYILVGFAAPLLTAAYRYLWLKFHRHATPLWTATSYLSALFGIGAVVLLCLQLSSKQILVVATLHWLVLLFLPSTRRNLIACGHPLRTITVCFGYLVICALGWAAVSSQPWWLGKANDNFLTFVTSDRLTLLIGLLAFFFTIETLHHPTPCEPTEETFRQQPWISVHPRLWFDSISIFVFGMLCLRTNPDLYHYSFYTGPIELVRDGGHILWDVPSQYGFLSILFPAALRFWTPWESLHHLTAFASFCASVILYFFLAGRDKSSTNRLLSFFLTVCGLHFVPGFPSHGIGPISYPSVSAYRFIWCIALLAMIGRVIAARVTLSAPKILMIRTFPGHILWILGSLWSAESMVYCSAVWLSGYFFIVAQRLVSTSQRLTISWRLYFSTAPFFLFIATIVAVSLFYLGTIGHFPEWYRLFEYATIYKNGFGGLPIDPRGSVTILTALLALILSFLLFQSGFSSRKIPLIVAVYCFLWSTASYFISRSHENNILNLASLITMAISVVFYLSGGLGENFNFLVKTATAPILVMLLTIGIGGYAEPTRFAKLSSSILSLNIRDILGKEDENLKTFLKSEGVLGTDHVTVFDPGNTIGEFTVWKWHNSWLPFGPTIEFELLSQDIGKIYFQRYINRFPNGGWILYLSRTTITGKSESLITHLSAPWQNQMLINRFRVVKAVQRGSWLLQRLEPKNHNSVR